MYISSINNSDTLNIAVRSVKIRSKDIKSRFTSRVPLDIASEGCRYFGVDSSNNIFSNLDSHVLLAKIMEKCKGIRKKFKPCIIDVDDTAGLIQKKDMLWGKNQKINNSKYGIGVLRDVGATRVNLVSHSLFGESVHTVGLVVDNKTNILYVLDSFGNKNAKIKEYHRKLAELFNGKTYKMPFQKPFSKIIFSTKRQQAFNEYTCNNWTFANIEALKNAIKKGKNITNSLELDKCLPNNINKILETQRRFVIKNREKLQ